MTDRQWKKRDWENVMQGFLETFVFLFGILTVIFFLIQMACATMNLERKLPNDIKAWYDLHQVIMDTYPPKALQIDYCSERRLFLTMPAGKQKEYIKLFWTIREKGIQEEYRLRVSVAKKWFRGEGIDGIFTDRGRAMLLFGQPDYREFRDQDGQLYHEGEEAWGYARQARYRWFQIWKYWYGQGFFQQLIDVIFEYNSQGYWREIPNNDFQYRQFVDYWRWRMGPTEDGWKMIKEFLNA